MWSGVIAAGFTAALGLVLTYFVRGTALRLGVVAAPRKDRWHQKPTALMGGVAIYLATIVGMGIFAPSLQRVWPLLLPATLLFLTGAVDDRIQLKPYKKLAMQIIAAAMTVTAGLDLQWTGNGAVNSLITIFWLVGITNAVNLLDNMDGLAAGISLISCLFLTITFGLNGQIAESFLPLTLAGAIAGFLVFNLKPASIFMGDCGSMFIGFMLGGIALLSDAGRMRNLLGVMLTPVLILSIPILDTCFVAIRRKLNGRAVSQGGRDHTSHHLVALGMSEPRAVLTLYVIALISGTLALLVREMTVGAGLALLAGFALIVAFLGLYLGKVRVYGEGEQPTGILVDAWGNFSHRRRVIEILLDTFLMSFTYYVAYLLRFDGDMPEEQTSIFIKTLPIIVSIQIFLFLVGGVYRGIWRYIGVDDLVTIAKSVFSSAAISGISILIMYKMHGPSRAVLILNGLILFFMIGASRLSFRLLGVLLGGGKSVDPDARPVLIYGAGDGGEILVRELLNNPDYFYRPIGFIDDDVMKKGKIIRGCRIFSSSEVPDVIHSYGVKDVLISSIKVPESKLEGLKSLGVGFKRLKIILD